MQQGSPTGNRAASPGKDDMRRVTEGRGSPIACRRFSSTARTADASVRVSQAEPPGGGLCDLVSEVIVSLVIVSGLAPGVMAGHRQRTPARSNAAAAQNSTCYGDSTRLKPRA
jgi:hypothetical protein